MATNLNQMDSAAIEDSTGNDLPDLEFKLVPSNTAIGFDNSGTLREPSNDISNLSKTGDNGSAYSLELNVNNSRGMESASDLSNATNVSVSNISNAGNNNSKGNKDSKGVATFISKDKKQMITIPTKGGFIDNIADEIDEVALKRARIFGILFINLGGFIFFAILYIMAYFIIPSYIFSVSFEVSYVIFIINTLYLLSMLYYYYIEDKFESTVTTPSSPTTSSCGLCTMLSNNFKLLAILKDKFEMIGPSITHFSDTASDIAVLIEFYQKSTKKSGGTTQEYINYSDLFWLTLGVILFYRVFSSLTVYNYSKSVYNSVLQFFDLYLFRVVFISVKEDMNHVSSLQRYLQYIESLFESAPQFLISLYVIIASWIFSNESASATVIICAIVSLYNVLSRSYDEDKQIIENYKFKALSCKSICNFNILYIARIMWRVCDILSHMLLLVLLAVISSVSTMVLLLILTVLLALIYPIIKLYLNNNLSLIFDEIVLFNVLIQTPVPHKRSQNGIVSTWYGVTRIVISMLMFAAVYYFDYLDFGPNSDQIDRKYFEFTLLYLISLGMFVFSLAFYVIQLSSEYLCCCCKCYCGANQCCSNLKKCSMLTRVKPAEMEAAGIGGSSGSGANEKITDLIASLDDSVYCYTNSSVVGSGITSHIPKHTLVTCKNMEDVYSIFAFEYSTSMSDIVNIETWINFEEPLTLMEVLLIPTNRKCIGSNWNYIISMSRFSNFMIFKNLWIGIFSNPMLSGKDAHYWIKLLETGKFEKFKDGKYSKHQSDELLKSCIKYQSNPAILALFIEKYDAHNSEELAKYAELHNKTANKDLIVTYLRSGLHHV